MKRYLALAEGYSGDDHYGKTTYGVIRYAVDPVVVVLDSTRAGEDVEGIPVVATVADALAYEPTVALVGVAVAGGRLPPVWRGILRDAIDAGLDVEAGMHEFLADDPEFAALARERGVELRDYRRPPGDLSVPTGENLTHGASVVLTVGSDCAVGKKTVAVELDRAARARGLRSVFVPTGQTGIMIAGWGIAVDAVVSDFLAGAGERLVVEGADAWRPPLRRGPGIDHPPAVLRRHARSLPRERAARARSRASRRGHRARGRPRPSDHPAPGADRALRTPRVAGPPGTDRRRCPQYRPARRRRKRGPRSHRQPRKPASRRTTLSVSDPTGCWTPCWPRCLRV